MSAELIDYAVTELGLAGKPFVVDAVGADGQVIATAESTDPSVPIFAQIVAAQQDGDHDRVLDLIDGVFDLAEPDRNAVVVRIYEFGLYVARLRTPPAPALPRPRSGRGGREAR